MGQKTWANAALKFYMEAGGGRQFVGLSSDRDGTIM